MIPTPNNNQKRIRNNSDPLLFYFLIIYNYNRNNMNQEFRRRQRYGRPPLPRRIDLDIKADYFKPQGIPMRHLEIARLSEEEVEALRLKNIEDKDQTQCAQAMKVSQSTFQRILSSAYKKISEALVQGKAIKIIRKDK